MILESIVTTVDADGNVNIAPMGPTVDPSFHSIVLRPFRSSRTYQNLMESPQAVVHVTDDAMLFARAAMDDIDAEQAAALTVPVGASELRRLADCHRWFHVEIDSMEQDDLRATMQCRIVESETQRPFFGFNRAKFAVLEAAILGTRTHLISRSEVETSITRLQELVDKTGGAQEVNAFKYLTQAIQARYDHQSETQHGGV